MSWKTMKLGDACTIEKGNIGIMKAIPGDFPLVVLGDERRSHNDYQFDTEAVIIPLVSSTGHGHRSMKRIHYQSGKFSVGNILCAVIPKDKTTLSTEFLYRYLDLNKEDELVSRMKGMANVSLPMKSIADVEIPVPPIEIQRGIIKRLEKVEKSNGALSSEHTIQLDFLRKLRQQILQDAVHGKLVPQDNKDEPASKLLELIKAEKEKLFQDKKIKKEKPLPEIKPEEIPFEIPENWVWCRLGEVITMIYGNSLIKAQCKINGKYPVYGSNGIVGYFDKFLTDKRAIIIGRKGSAGALNICVVPSWTTDVAFYVEENTNFNFHFSYYLLKSLELETLGKGIKPGVNRSEVYNIPIPVPPLKQQDRIVTKIEQLMKLCDELEQSIQQNQKYTQELLQVALKEALEP